MSVPMMPHRFVDASTLDMEKVNDNLEAGARDVNRNLSRRYTYSSLVFDLSGVADTDAAVLRQFAIRRPNTNNAAEVTGVELVLYTATAVTWSLSCSDTTWATLTLLTTASASTESYAAQLFPVAVASSSADLVFTLSASAASTITNGYLVVHLRCDRGNQGTSHAGYTPTLVDSASSTAGSLLDTELTALASAVTNDTTNDIDLRCECFVARNLLAATQAVFRAPSGARRIHAVTAYAVQNAAGTTTSVAVGTSFDSCAVAVMAGAGVAARAVSTTVASGDVTMVDTPMTATTDATITFSVAAQTALLLYLLVWWS